MDYNTKILQVQRFKLHAKEDYNLAVSSLMYVELKKESCMAIFLHLDHNFKVSTNQEKSLSLSLPEAEYISPCLIMLHN